MGLKEIFTPDNNIDIHEIKSDQNGIESIILSL